MVGTFYYSVPSRIFGLVICTPHAAADDDELITFPNQTNQLNSYFACHTKFRHIGSFNIYESFRLKNKTGYVRL